MRITHFTHHVTQTSCHSTTAVNVVGETSDEKHSLKRKAEARSEVGKSCVLSQHRLTTKQNTLKTQQQANKQQKENERKKRQEASTSS